MSVLNPSKRGLILNGLRVFWILTMLWYEYGIFPYSARSCPWPDDALIDHDSHVSSNQGPIHVLIIADPQILDHRSYPERPGFLTYISQVVVDLNLRKSWRAAVRSRPDAVFILGDMMDNGRFEMSDDEYELYYRRFTGVFQLDERVPKYFIPGNHDTGLGSSAQFSPKARTRYTSHFGPLNSYVSIANNTIALLDAPSLVEEDYLRHGRGKSYHEWKPIHNGTIEFIKTLAARDDSQPLILLSHIPLSRPEGSSCGPLRERGTIHRGVGLGYQNTLGKDSSRFLLKSLRPSLIFSGDDHDYCEYTHTLEEGSRITRIREVTVKSLSMAMGIRQPGYHLLSLVPPTGLRITHADSPCMMPDQLGIYLSIYLPLGLVSFFVIFTSCIIRRQSHRNWHWLSLSSKSSLSHLKSRSVGADEPMFQSNRKRLARSRINVPTGDSFQSGYTLDGDEEEKLPNPVSARHAKSTTPGLSWTFVMQGRRRRIVCGLGTLSVLGRKMLAFGCSRGDFVREFWRDVGDVAMFPLGIFFLISIWTMWD